MRKHARAPRATADIPNQNGLVIDAIMRPDKARLRVTVTRGLNGCHAMTDRTGGHVLPSSTFGWLYPDEELSPGIRHDDTTTFLRRAA